MTKPADSELLSLDKAAAALGWEADQRPRSGGKTKRAERLLTAVQAREAEMGLAILHRRKGAHRTTLRVTMYALREHLPELFPGAKTRATDEGAFRRTLRSIDQKLDARDARLDARISRVEHDGQVTREMIQETAERLDRLVGPDPDAD